MLIKMKETVIIIAVIAIVAALIKHELILKMNRKSIQGPLNIKMLNKTKF